MRLVALRDALGAVLPDAVETELLRACLLPGEPGRDGWRAFADRAGDLREQFRADRGSRKRLGPLLAAALRDNSVAADPEFLTVLRTAHLREELRAEIYSDILAEVLAALDSIGAPVLVLKGAAFGSTLYASPTLRHSHDIDLLVREGDVARAADVLESRGFRRTGPAQVEHRRSLPVNLHARLLPSDHPRFSFEEVWARRRETLIAGRTVNLLSPGDSLFQVLGLSALYPARRSLQWACDAWHLIGRMREGDWQIFLDQVTSDRLALWCWVRLEFLAARLSVGIPAPVRSALIMRARGAGSLERDFALYAARADSGNSGLRQVLRGSTVPARVLLFLWLLFPSPAYMRSALAGGSHRGLPAMYLGRVFRYLAAMRRRAASPVPGL